MIRLTSNALPLKLPQHFHSLLQFLVLLYLRVVWIILREEGSGRHEAELVALFAERALTLHCVVHRVRNIIELHE